MSIKNTFSICVLVVGIGLFGYGSYISYKAAQGAEKISEAEERQESRRKPLIGPIRKGINEQATEHAQEKISHEAQAVVASRVSSSWLQGSGIVLVVLGIGFLIGSSRKRSK